MNDRLHVCSSVHEGNWSTDVEEKDEAHGTIVNLGREMSLCSITKQCKPVVCAVGSRPAVYFQRKATKHPTTSTEGKKKESTWWR